MNNFERDFQTSKLSIKVLAAFSNQLGSGDILPETRELSAILENLSSSLMSTWRHKWDKPYTRPKYLIECMFCNVQQLQTNFSGSYWPQLIDIEILRDSTCDVTCMSLLIQDGSQLKCFSHNISRIKRDMKKLHKAFVIYFVANSLIWIEQMFGANSL